MGRFDAFGAPVTTSYQILHLINAVCGNSVVEAGETCDDGNTDNGDGCSSVCALEAGSVCGNSVVEAGETCDDGNAVAGDGCSAVCLIESGGSSYVCNVVDGALDAFVANPVAKVDQVEVNLNWLISKAPSSASNARVQVLRGLGSTIDINQMSPLTILSDSKRSSYQDTLTDPLLFGQTFRYALRWVNDCSASPVLYSRPVSIPRIYRDGDPLPLEIRVKLKLKDNRDVAMFDQLRSLFDDTHFTLPPAPESLPPAKNLTFELPFSRATRALQLTRTFLYQAFFPAGGRTSVDSVSVDFFNRYREVLLQKTLAHLVQQSYFSTTLSPSDWTLVSTEIDRFIAMEMLPINQEMSTVRAIRSAVQAELARRGLSVSEADALERLQMMLIFDRLYFPFLI
ncbi:DUF4215 domain-containing protein [Candidatus Peregrinibacteria bacterium]|nr:MAG: DUF4215 domain-containing protein [Candidatus Peregrinibacteria bacterium]